VFTKSDPYPHTSPTPIKKAAWRWLAGIAAVLCLALVPVGAMAANVGVGEMDGHVTFSTPVPSITQQTGGTPCANTTFDLVGRSVGAAQATSINGYAGQFKMTGQGAGCENASNGNGSIRLEVESARAANGQPFVQCSDVTGTYIRIGTAVTAIVNGSCKINNQDNTVTVIFHGEFVPEDGQGYDTPITGATFYGAYTFVPV
jgi:hypothetical protein